MNLTNWSPLRDLDDFFADYRDMFGRSLSPQGKAEISSADFRWRPVADISENSDEYLVKAQLPEVKREDVSVTIDEGMLKIEGERKLEKTSADEKQHRVESFYGSFFRAFALPENVDQSKIRAECEDGVLRVHLPKIADRKAASRKISIK